MERLQFIAALIVAALGDSWRKLKEIRDALRAEHWIDSDLAFDRFELGCKRCPMFFKPLGTCGSPLRKSDIEGFDGCWCHCKTLCKSETNCTAFDHFRGQTLIGWPKELNSFPDIYDNEQP